MEFGRGACYPFREELSTGILNIQFTPEGRLLAGGTNRGWPVRGLKPFALERLEWSGKMPFEIKEVTITPKGFKLDFTKQVEAKSASEPTTFVVKTFTHKYHQGYGGPEINQTEPAVKSVKLANDGMSVVIELEALKKGHVHEFDLAALRSWDGGKLLHRHAYYTVNEVPEK